jgi:hypothetical protein
MPKVARKTGKQERFNFKGLNAGDLRRELLAAKRFKAIM